MNKKAFLIIFLTLIVSGILTFVILSNTYFKNTETYTLNNFEISRQQDRAGKVEVSFELAKKLNYQVENRNSYSVKLKNPDNLSSIDVKLLDDTKREIIMEEGDFQSERFQDYQLINRHGFEGYQIFYRTDLYTEFTITLLVNEYEYDKDGEAQTAYDGVIIKVTQSPNDDKKIFNTEEFVNSKDFQHLLDSIKVTAP